jgi:hypothetical protein
MVVPPNPPAAIGDVRMVSHLTGAFLLYSSTTIEIPLPYADTHRH